MSILCYRYIYIYILEGFGYLDGVHSSFLRSLIFQSDKIAFFGYKKLCDAMLQLLHPEITPAGIYNCSYFFPEGEMTTEKRYNSQGVYNTDARTIGNNECSPRVTCVF